MSIFINKIEIMKIKKNEKVINLTESDLMRIVTNVKGKLNEGVIYACPKEWFEDSPSVTIKGAGEKHLKVTLTSGKHTGKHCYVSIDF